MIDVIGVSFEENGRIYYFAPAGLALSKDEMVVVETERGLQLGLTITCVLKFKKENLNLPLKTVIRIATIDDIESHKRNLIDNKKAFVECKKLIEKNKLDMNLIDASFTLDRKQLLFHFTADSRIDFRELAKELASIYRTRIELRQIGIRDKARSVGGIGPCGRVLCCTNFLYNFDSVSINMAKNQNIALNPNKINGSCGRLLCCLTYENDTYLEARSNMPDVGQIMETKEGFGKVIAVDILGKTYKLEIPEVGIITVKVNDESN
jgi:cell fate regulator YaaT (PSP1 superfamily)